MKTAPATSRKRVSSKQPLEEARGKNPREKEHTIRNKERVLHQAIHCPRCHGLMSPEWCFNLNYDAGEMEILTWRCLQCGELIDPVILRNRQKPASATTKKQSRSIPSTIHGARGKKSKRA